VTKGLTKVAIPDSTVAIIGTGNIGTRLAAAAWTSPST